MKKKMESMIWLNRVIINEKSLYRNNSILLRILVCKKRMWFYIYFIWNRNK